MAPPDPPGRSAGTLRPHSSFRGRNRRKGQLPGGDPQPTAYHSPVLDISGGEFIVILLVALVVLGPTRLPEMARKAGQWSRELRDTARELRAGLEAEVKEVRQVVEEARRPLQEAAEELKSASSAFDEAASPTRMAWTGPKPVSGPTPGEAMEDLAKIEQGLPLEEEPRSPE